MIPTVTIVTPSFQAGRFLEQTIQSVLMQDYPSVEYIVMDGGSTDGTLEILKRYRDHLRYVSAPDGGAADAINRGFALSRGEILAWLNADDYYFPGAITAMVRHFAQLPSADVIYGEGIWVDEKNREIDRYPTVTPYHPTMFERECGICQPTAFVRRHAATRVGMLDPALHFAFDYDFWVRLSRTARFEAVSETIAASRMHQKTKTLGSRDRIFEENIALLRTHYRYVPFAWVYGQLAHRKDGRDQFFEPLRHSIGTYLTALPYGLRYNYRCPWRYLWEWARLATPANLRKTGANRAAVKRPQEFERRRPS